MLGNKQENVKERIIDASIRLFLAKGFAGATTKELTDAAGVAKGTLYWYFSGKDQILDEILEKFSHELYDQAFEKVKNTEGNFVARFKALYRFITEFAREKKELLLVSTTVLGEIAGTGSSAEQTIRGIQMKAHDFIKALLDVGQKEGTVRRELDTNIQAHIILASLVGMHLEWCLHGDSIDAVAYARAYRDHILRGLGIQE
jgi:AcrR family transcriptional regulator